MTRTFSFQWDSLWRAEHFIFHCKKICKGAGLWLLLVLPKENHQILYSTRQIWAKKYNRMVYSSPDSNREKMEQEERKKMETHKEEQMPIRILAGCSKE